MAKNSVKLRLRSGYKRQKKQVEAADDHIEKHFVRRLVSLSLVKRFVFGWLVLMVLLIIAVIMQLFALNSHYKEQGPIRGGVYREGIIGTYKNANPIYAAGTTDSSVSRLVFSGLLKYDDDHNLVGDLAEKWEIDKTEKVYTIHLRQGVKWHDGRPFTARDVVFTVKTIQNAASESVLRPGWSEVEVQAKDDNTVVFKLPSIYGAFVHSLTFGILPEHILGSLPPEKLRSSNFNNIQPVGTGPFKLDTVEVLGKGTDKKTARIGLSSYDDYHFGKPPVSKFIISTYVDDKSLIEAFGNKQIDAMVGLTEVPQELKDEKNTAEYGVPLAAETMVFFRTSNDILSDSKVRQALVLGANRAKIIASIGYPLLPADSPLLPLHQSYDKRLTQQTNDFKQANRLLDKAGWKMNRETKIREKRGQKLTIKLQAQATSELSKVSEQLQKEWQALGADVQVMLQDKDDIQTTTSLHNYDALISTISIGPDPDVFAYWHSSQADVRSPTRLNLSEYKSSEADQALELGRARTDPRIRAVKYKPFLRAWLSDAPALALYQPRFLYIVRSPLYNFDVKSAVTAADRFNNVQNWMVREGLVPKTTSQD